MANPSFKKLFGVGCGDNSCYWGPPGGMATNGGCHCYREIKDFFKRAELASGIFLLRQLSKLPEVEAALADLIKKAKENP